MKLNVYTDESWTVGEPYKLIGGIWVPQQSEAGIRQVFTDLRDCGQLSAEFKWTKVSKGKLPEYSNFVDIFFDHEAVFHCIVLPSRLLNYRAFHGGDEELGFYKFYYQLISRKVIPGNVYSVFTDERHSRYPYRLEVLKITTNRWCMKRYKLSSYPIRVVEPRRSHEEDFLQLVDVLLGATAAKWNSSVTSTAKLALIEHIEHRQGVPLDCPTHPSERKFNIWFWKPY